MVKDGLTEVFQGVFHEYGSEWMINFSKHLWAYTQWLMDARRPRESVIRDCDGAFLAENYIPDTGGAIQLIETGEYGDTDVFDNVRLKAIRTAITLMPRQDRWIVASSNEGETAEDVHAMEDYHVYLHSKARTRRQLQRHYCQKEVRGRSGIYWEWDEQVVWKRYTDRSQNRAQLAKWMVKAGLSAEQARQLNRGKYPVTTYSGPVITPIDWYDLWVDPLADLVTNRVPSKILRRFYTVAKLKAIKDPLTNEDLFKLPDGFEATPVSEILGDRDFGSERQASAELLGQNLPVAGQGEYEQRLVPVYIIYMPYIEYKQEEFWDTYFYLAIDHKGQNPVVCRIEENPNDAGHSHILIDDHIDWFTPTAGGGIGSVEKQLGIYWMKCFMRGLVMTGAAHSVIPSFMGDINAWRDVAEISFLPGDINHLDLDGKSLENVLKAITLSNPQAVAMGEQLMRFGSEEMRATSGVDGLVQDNAARTMNSRKTATEIQRDTSSGSLVLDNQAENDVVLLNDLIAGIAEIAKDRVEPVDGMVEYERFLSGQIAKQKIPTEVFQAARSFHIFAQTGQFSKQARLDSVIQGLEVAGQVSQTLGPMIQPFVMEGFTTLWRELGISMPQALQQMEQQGMAPGMMPGMQPQGGMPMDQAANPSLGLMGDQQPQGGFLQ